VAGALSSGGRAAAGGAALDRPGYFFAPTILTDAGETSGIVAEEQFGPALPVVAYRELDDAIERGEGVARQLEAGSAWVDTHAAPAPKLPFDGLQWSGIGVENGTWGPPAVTERGRCARPGSRRGGLPRVRCVASATQREVCASRMSSAKGTAMKAHIAVRR
jgi:acyl-CoA reductase-like NAD-dependent aldehyde dehydrogenase